MFRKYKKILQNSWYNYKMKKVRFKAPSVQEKESTSARNLRSIEMNNNLLTEIILTRMNSRFLRTCLVLFYFYSVNVGCLAIRIRVKDYF